MAAHASKVTVQLPPALIEQMRDAVAAGQAASQRALIEQALVRYLHDLRRAMVRADMAAAMKDPLFIADVEEVRRDFAEADAEAIRRIEER